MSNGGIPRALARAGVLLGPPLVMALFVRLAVAVGWTHPMPMVFVAIGVGALVLNHLLQGRTRSIRIMVIVAYGAAMWLPTLLLGVFGTCVLHGCA